MPTAICNNLLLFLLALRVVGKEIGAFSDPLPYPIIPIHFLEKSLKNPSLFFRKAIIKWGGICLKS